MFAQGKCIEASRTRDIRKDVGLENSAIVAELARCEEKLCGFLAKVGVEVLFFRDSFERNKASNGPKFTQ